MDLDKAENAWGVVKPALGKLAKDEAVTLQEIFAVEDFLREFNLIYSMCQSAIPKQKWGRRFRKEDGKYIEDENGDYKSMRGMFGQTWYVPINPFVTTKHITPF